MNINQMIKDETASVTDYVIATRRTLHTIAEVASNEFKTSAFIQEQLKTMGIPFECLETTGILAELDTHKPGPVIALRADIDALAIAEKPCNLKRERIVMSDDPQVFHACGHDGHTAMLLGSIKALINLQEHLSGKIYFCFEEGEEVGTGINAMMKALEDKNIDTVWGIHLLNSLPVGQISVDSGPRLAGLAKIDFTIHGQGGHGSRPDLSVNPVFTAAMILNNLTTTFANQIDANETVTLGITSIVADTAFNVITNDARVKGSYRFFNVKEGEKAIALSRKVFENTADMCNASIEYAPDFGIHLYPTINDAEKSAIAHKNLVDLLGEETVVSFEPWYASESFHRYLDCYPGVFAFVGIQNLDDGIGAQHHNEYFDLDENALAIGTMATLRYVFNFQEV